MTCLFHHHWSDWFETEGGWQDCYGDFVLRETPVMKGWGRYCTKCGKKEFRV